MGNAYVTSAVTHTHSTKYALSLSFLKTILKRKNTQLLAQAHDQHRRMQLILSVDKFDKAIKVNFSQYWCSSDIDNCSSYVCISYQAARIRI